MLKPTFCSAMLFFFVVCSASATVIDHNSIDGVASLPQSTMDAIGQQRWYFTHASVGGNMISGMNNLHGADATRYQLVITSDDSTPPANTTPGTVYEYNRGNPGWEAKFTIFSSAVNAGWQSPKIDFAMDKLCYIDQNADASVYLDSMASLESNYPDTTFVYMTMPLTTSEDSNNYLRHQYNTAVRNYCITNDKLLFDIADIEAFDPSGNAITFDYSGTICQKLYSGYTSDGGHLNTTGSNRVAMGWYAVGATAVPEPGTFVLIAMAGSAIMFARRPGADR